MFPGLVWYYPIVMRALLVLVALLFVSSAHAAAPLSTAAPILQQVAQRARDASLDERERVEAIGVLGQWATADVRGPLLDVLRDPKADIRAAAARALGWPDNDPAIAPLRARVEDPAEPATVRVAALVALAKIGKAVPRDVFVAATRDAEGKVREEGFRPLIEGDRIDRADLVPLAVRAVQDEGVSLQFRAEAIRALARAGDRSVVPVLVKIVETGRRIKMPVPPPNATQQQLMPVRYQQIRDLRAWATRALADLGDRSVVPLVLTVAEDPDDYFLRLQGVYTLIVWQVPQGLPVMVRLLQDPSHDVRTAATAGAGVLGNASTVDPVAGRLKDDHPGVRAQAALALGQLGGPAAKRHLTDARQSEKDPQVLQALEAALSRLAK